MNKIADLEEFKARKAFDKIFAALYESPGIKPKMALMSEAAAVSLEKHGLICLCPSCTT